MARKLDFNHVLHIADIADGHCYTCTDSLVRLRLAFNLQQLGHFHESLIGDGSVEG